ncbi:MAG TPA: hypothetical protein VHL14_12345 [Steroidobacteraceae bacterium]|nr:hypothetical protein [Steroidobacteraceae bacterium]
MKKSFVILMLIFVVTGPSVAGVNKWTSNGPEGGGVWHALYVTDKPGLVVATAGHSIYRSTDNGASWTSVYDGIIVHRFVPIISDPSNSNRFLLLGANQGLLLSVDGGQSFTTIQSITQSINNYLTAGAISADGQVWYVGTYTGEIYRSVDQGASWQLRSNGIPTGTYSLGVTRILVDPQNHDHIYATITYSPADGLYYSNNGGVSWSPLPTQICTFVAGCEEIAINPVNHNQLLAATQAGMFLSIDSGMSWVLKDARSFTTVQFDPLTSNRVYAATYGNEIVISNDGGATWPTSSRFPIDGSASFVFDPSQKNRILLCTGDGAYLSDDGGTNWAPRSSGIRGVFTNRLISVPAKGTEPARIYAINYYGTRGFYSYDASTQNWSQLGRSSLFAIDPNLLISSLAPDFNDSNVLYAGGESSKGLYRSKDRGASWQKFSSELDAQYISDVAVSPSNPQQIFAVGSSIMYSENSGINFVPRSNGANIYGRVYLAFDRKDPTTLFVYADGTHGVPIYKTEDSGMNWTPSSSGIVSDGGEYRILRVVVDPSDSSIVYAATSNGLYKSTTGGSSWIPLVANSFDMDFDLDVTNPSHLIRLVRNQQYSIYRSVDAGATWEGLNSPGLAWSVTFDYTTRGGIMAAMDSAGIASIQLAPDLEISSAASTVVASTAQTVKFDVRNRGPYAASNASLVTRIPKTGTTAQTTQGTCSVNSNTGTVTCLLGAIASEKVATVTLQLPTLESGQVVAEVAANESDPSLSNNSLTLAVATPSPSSTSSNTNSSNGGSGTLDWRLIGLLAILWIATQLRNKTSRSN